MVFHRAKIKPVKHLTICIDNVKLSRVEFTKFLGVIIDEKINWTNHSQYIINKISKSIAIICKAK